MYNVHSKVLFLKLMVRRDKDRSRGTDSNIHTSKQTDIRQEWFIVKSNLLGPIIPVYSKELFIELLLRRDKDSSRGTDSNIQTSELHQE